MPEVEAHITGTVWKIEVEVGDSVEEGDTVVILESMKMEMPVEAEDPGVVKEICCRRGSRSPRATRSLSSSEPATGDSCWSTSRRRGSTRLTISNPGKRGALDHAILDGFTSTMAAARRPLRDHHRRADDVLRRL